MIIKTILYLQPVINILTLRPAEFESTQIAWKATSLPLTYGRL